MRRFELDDPALAFDRPAVTVGVFDGVHRGHVEVLSELVRWAGEGGVDAVALTFARHPREVLTGAGPELLASLEHRLLLLERTGLAGVVLLPFERIKGLAAEAFVRDVLAGRLRASRVLVGTNHRFGRGREGDFALLRRLGAELGFEAREQALTVDEGVVSSTAIREAIAGGRLDDAARLLGRPVSVLGQVVPGDRRGRLLGFPTANLDLEHAARPPRGVYAARARVVRPAGDPAAPRGEGPLHPAVVNIGRRPTFHPEADVDLVEVHLLEGGGDLYGALLEVVFASKLRDERRFAGPGELRAQIERDVAAAREALAPA